MVVRHSYPTCVCVTPPAPGLSKLPIVDGTSHVVAPKKFWFHNGANPKELTHFIEGSTKA
jgi:hypothetical protein